MEKEIKCEQCDGAGRYFNTDKDYSYGSGLETKAHKEISKSVWVVTSIISDSVVLHSAFETEKEARDYAGVTGNNWHNVKQVYLKQERVPIKFVKDLKN